MSDFFFVSAAIVLALCVAVCVWSAHSAVRALVSLRQHPRYSESRIASLEQSVADVQSALTDVANRVKMMRVRNAANHVQGDRADPYTNPDAWRREMNKQLAMRGSK